MDETKYRWYLPTETTVLYANAPKAYMVASYMPRPGVLVLPLL